MWLAVTILDSVISDYSWKLTVISKGIYMCVQLLSHI